MACVGGPVISQRRSSNPGAGGAIRQVGVRTHGFGLGEELEDAGFRVPAGFEQFGPPAREAAVQVADEAKCGRAENHIKLGMGRSVHGDHAA